MNELINYIQLDNESNNGESSEDYEIAFKPISQRLKRKCDILGFENAEWEDVFNAYAIGEVTDEQKVAIRELLFLDKELKNQRELFENFMKVVKISKDYDMRLEEWSDAKEKSENLPFELWIEVDTKIRPLKILLRKMKKNLSTEEINNFLDFNSSNLSKNELEILKSAIENIENHRNLFRVVQFSNRIKSDNLEGEMLELSF